MVTHSQIRTALRGHLISLNGLPSEFAWEGRTYTPQPRMNWLRERYLPAGSPVVALGSEAIIEETILYQIDVYVWHEEKLMIAEDMADTIRAGFRPGLSVRVTDQSSVTFRRAERAALVPDPEWHHIPVTIRTSLHRQNLPI